MTRSKGVFRSQCLEITNKVSFYNTNFQKKERFSSLITFFGAKIQMKLKEMRLFLWFLNTVQISKVYQKFAGTKNPQKPIVYRPIATVGGSI